MLDKYTEDIETLMDWFEKSKQIVIIAESLDTINKGYIQPLNEQRYCLDHFMRALQYENDNEQETIIRKAIASASGHLQRAYSDAIEWILVSVRDEYGVVLKGYTNEQINQAFPEYYKEIRPELERITKIVNNYKINKSFEKDSSIISYEEINKMEDIANKLLAEDVAKKLQEYITILHSRQTSLIEIKKRDDKRNVMEKIIIPIVTAIIASVITALLLR